ncbi:MULTISPECIES: hypothetical protein [Mucilaginibacter]|uniref:hypothetical protein n=1 Tax=Mucilaginibacter TaxID=423349 RepID=UPI0008718160|nr:MULTISPECIES: hypothetical protein [Mucilaginibacter]NVM66813.1 hypothetical protein [Mucilaginibacter sp. SG538B]QTE39687.1 hypothetical protein J3L18_11715 [Mucilaginibacter gossypii]GGB29818.1 hypothetical protein GCM10011500_52750 [Mucilaginibacter rubeus]SCW80391.1 hypothetical protein SAMN03159284_04376 [Mucilaginibacter sp. NFR10]
MSIPKDIKKEGTRISPVKAGGQKAKEIKTEGPLSEKDEVKQAEERTNKGLKKR